MDVLTDGNQFEIGDRSRMSKVVKILILIGICVIILLIATVSIVMLTRKIRRKEKVGEGVDTLLGTTKAKPNLLSNVHETERGVSNEQSTEHLDSDVLTAEHEESASLPFSMGTPTKFRYQDLMIATNNFDIRNELGKGGFGEVFKGDINNRIVAVKRLKKDSNGCVTTFEAEVKCLGLTSHVHLVKLVGYCLESSHYLIVYEYMNNGSLAEWIFESD